MQNRECPERPVCPVCGGQPTIHTAFRGQAYYALCSECSWEGDIRNIEISPSNALDIWYEKAEREK